MIMMIMIITIYFYFYVPLLFVLVIKNMFTDWFTTIGRPIKKVTHTLVLTRPLPPPFYVVVG